MLKRYDAAPPSATRGAVCQDHRGKQPGSTTRRAAATSSAHAFSPRYGEAEQGLLHIRNGLQDEQGKFGVVPLGGLGFMIIGFTPGEMGKGNWSAGVIVDERASTEQRNAIVAVASGAAVVRWRRCRG